MLVAVAQVQRAGAAESSKGSKSAQRKGSAGRFAPTPFVKLSAVCLEVEMEYWSSGGLPLARFTVR